MNKEQQELLDEVYENYKKEILRQRQLQKEEVNRLRSQGKRLKVSLIELLTKEEFIDKCKTDTEFSERWGLKIEERELGLEERETLLLEIDDTFRTSTTQEIKLVLDEYNIPTKLITITYNDKTIESYES
jgi:hypothetical protein